jgi:hypothetical protein
MPDHRLICQVGPMTGEPKKPSTGGAAVFHTPDGAHAKQTGGRGPFVSRVEWQHSDGGSAIWDSRRARKRGFIEVIRDGVVQRIRARPARAIRLGRFNAISGVSFFFGGAFFTLGAVLSALEVGSPVALDWTFLVGGFFFSTGAYAALVQEINSPHGIEDTGELIESPWRWWSYNPQRPGWTAAFVLFCGTLAFAISLLDVFMDNLDRPQQDHLIWAPEMVGCVLFLVSGHIGIIEICHGRVRLLPSSLGWWIVTVNQLGSWLFLLSGLAAYIRPATGDVVSVALINWGTALGAACFSIAGLAQLFERPDSAPAPARPDAGVGPSAEPVAL